LPCLCGFEIRIDVSIDLRCMRADEMQMGAQRFAIDFDIDAEVTIVRPGRRVVGRGTAPLRAGA
jgi:hypothetical protein